MIQKGFLHRIEIDPKSARTIKEELRDLGISRATLFPDLEGVAPRSQHLLKVKARSETRRLDLDEKAQRLERAIQADVDRVFRHVTNAADFLDRGRVREALSEIQRAMQAERSLSELGRALKALWDYLARMSGSEIDIQKYLDANGPGQ